MNIAKTSMKSLMCIFILFSFLFTSCGGDKFKEVDLNQFKGTWVLQGRTMFDGIKIKIEKNSEGEFKGSIVSINENKFVKMFAEIGDSWVSEISRNSNYEFKLVENKIGSALFSLYGLETSKEFKVQFIDENTIGLSTESGNPQSSTVKYVREN